MSLDQLQNKLDVVVSVKEASLVLAGLGHLGVCGALSRIIWGTKSLRLWGLILNAEQQ